MSQPPPTWSDPSDPGSAAPYGTPLVPGPQDTTPLPQRYAEPPLGYDAPLPPSGFPVSPGSQPGFGVAQVPPGLPAGPGSYGSPRGYPPGYAPPPGYAAGQPYGAPQAYGAPQQYAGPVGYAPGYAGGWQPDPTAPFGRDPLTGRPLSDKSKVAAGLLQLFLGQFGVGRFYLGYTGIGLTQLLLTVFGIITSFIGIGVIVIIGVGIWILVDAIMMFTGSVPDSRGLPLRS